MYYYVLHFYIFMTLLLHNITVTIIAYYKNSFLHIITSLLQHNYIIITSLLTLLLLHY